MRYSKVQDDPIPQPTAKKKKAVSKLYHSQVIEESKEVDLSVEFGCIAKGVTVYDEG